MKRRGNRRGAGEEASPRLKIPKPYSARVGTLGTLALTPSPQAVALPRQGVPAAVRRGGGGGRRAGSKMFTSCVAHVNILNILNQKAQSREATPGVVSMLASPQRASCASWRAAGTSARRSHMSRKGWMLHGLWLSAVAGPRALKMATSYCARVAILTPRKRHLVSFRHKLGTTPSQEAA